MRWLLTLAMISIAAPAHADDADNNPWAITWQGMVAHVGGAYTPGPRAASGTVLGLGYRIEAQRLGFELGVAGDNIQPSDWDKPWSSDGDWILRDGLAVGASYLVPAEGVRASLGAGLGIGTNRVHARDPANDRIVEFRERSGHADLRAGIMLTGGPVIGFDLALRLPFSPIETPQSSAWWPTIDATLTVGVGTAPTRASVRASVVIADVVGAVLMWGGTVVFVGSGLHACDVCSGDPTELAGGIVAAGGAIFALGAPGILAANDQVRGARHSALYRAVIVGVPALVGGIAGGADGLAAGTALGALFGSLAAPFVDYYFAK